jgi:hypothetical protein
MAYIEFTYNADFREWLDAATTSNLLQTLRQNLPVMTENINDILTAYDWVEPNFSTQIGAHAYVLWEFSECALAIQQELAERSEKIERV